MVFLPGDHTLDVDFTVADVSSLTLCGQSSSSYVTTVVCSGAVGFNFSSMLDFKIHSVSFTYCGRNFGSPEANKYTLLLESIEFAELVNTSFHDNLGTALVVYNTDITLADSMFTHNHCDREGNTTCVGGGGISALDSNLTLTGNTTFIQNSATFGSAGIYVINCSVSTIGNIYFRNNSNTDSASDELNVAAAALWASGSSLSFTGTSDFTDNFAISGGAIYVEYASLDFTGTTNFINNSASAGDGGAISTGYDTSLSFSGTSNFIDNSVDCEPGSHGGGAIFANLGSALSFTGTCNFIHNSAQSCDGGAIYIRADTSSFTGASNFISNSADFGGKGGAVYVNANSLYFTGTSNFSGNTAVFDKGGAIYVDTNTSVSFNGTTNVINNHIDIAGDGGGIYASVNTSLSFTGTASFINNSVLNLLNNGGGVYLMGDSIIFISPNTTVYWENNRAALGGAIYVDDQSNPFVYCSQIDTCTTNVKCFFQLPGQNLSSGIDSRFVFKDNYADVAGSALYGGAIDKCELTGLDSYSSGEVFDMLVDIEGDNDTSTISSDIFRVCPCDDDNRPNCSKSDIRPTVYPGETFHVSVVTLGQRNGTFGQRNGTMRASVIGQFQNTITQRYRETSNLRPFQYIQATNPTCTTLNYTVFTHSHLDIGGNLELYADGPCSTFGDKLVLALTINQNCPHGFILSFTEGSCVCNERLAKYTNSCDITDGLGQITRDSHQHFWVGYDPSSGLILHPHCPLDYCVAHSVEFPLSNTSAQCDYNRAGLLCGACKANYSLVFGTTECKKCTNIYLLLLIPFAVMGLALVFFLIVCKLTVATGTLSGLVFYANIVGVNRSIFLPGGTTNVLSVFIAWLNLDFGFESCFYNGMDAYSKTWLQFVFPVYIWVIVGLLIFASHFSQRFAKLLGNNPVSVLATLILLSYTKILRTLISAIYVTYLEYPTYNRNVWLYDANIDYLSGKHIPLFLVALLIFLFLFLPYTLLLLFGQWLQAFSHLRVFAWINNSRLKPFMDSYHAPYKPKYRYWPGLLLVLRVALLLIFAFNPQENPSVNLLAILVGCGVLLVWAWISGGVYRKWSLDALESLFALNLIILAGCTYHVNLSGGNQLAVGYTSVTIALVLFVVILAYHIFLRIGCTKKCKKLNLESSQPKFKDGDAVNDPINDDETADTSELREPLLEDSPKPTFSTVTF